MALSRPHRMANSRLQVRLQRTGGAQPVDPVYKTKIGPRQEQFVTALELEGQPRFMAEEMLIPTATGDGIRVQGYICFARKHLAQKGLTNPDTLKHALVVGFERENGEVVMEPTEYQIVEVRNRGHLTGGPILVKCFFRIYKDKRGAT